MQITCVNKNHNFILDQEIKILVTVFTHTTNSKEIYQYPDMSHSQQRHLSKAM